MNKKAFTLQTAGYPRPSCCCFWPWLTPRAASAASGLKGEYFNGYIYNTPVDTRPDPALDFDFDRGTGAP